MNQKNDSKKNYENYENGKKNKFLSNNMFYIYYTEYFDNLKTLSYKRIEKGGYVFASETKAICNFEFNLSESPQKYWEKIPNYIHLELKTIYPGLIIGSGYTHELPGNDILKNGLSLDYVTGLPWIPGSSLKGLLRSVFQISENDMKLAYINSNLREDLSLTHDECTELEESIFNSGDLFLGAFPSSSNKDKKLLSDDFITPHSNCFENPKPIRILKIKPNIEFEFGFILKDSCLSSGKCIKIEDKKILFEKIITDFGLGAKTNTGFGQFIDKS